MLVEKTDNGVSNLKEIVFIPIFREDRDFVNRTKGKKNRAERLHDIITSYSEKLVEAEAQHARSVTRSDGIIEIYDAKGERTAVIV